MAHGGRGVEEEEEEHTAPGDDVKAVYYHDESQGCQKEFPECFESYDGGFAPRFLRRGAVAVGVDAVFIGNYWFRV